MPHALARRLRSSSRAESQWLGGDGAHVGGETFSNAREASAPLIMEGQVSELSISSEISKINKTYSFAAGMKDVDSQEVEKLRKIEFQKLPPHKKAAEKILEFFEILLSFFTGRKHNKYNLSPTARKAIAQLRQLAALYSAMPHKSLEQTIVFDAAFGKAYYEILSSSYKNNSRGLSNTTRETSNYQRAIDGFIETLS